MVFEAVFAGLVLGQGKSVRFDAAGTLGSSIKSLSNVIGERLDVAPALDSEVVVIHVTDVDQEELLSKIATVVTGRWRSTSTGQILERTPEIDFKLKAASEAR